MPIKKVETILENDSILVEMVTVEHEPMLLRWSEVALPEDWPTSCLVKPEEFCPCGNPWCCGKNQLYPCDGLVAYAE